MKTVKFTTSNDSLFCPVTGQQIFAESGELTSSPALVFCYIDMTEEFEFATNQIKDLYKKCEEIELKEYQTTYNIFAEKLNQENWLCLYLFDESGEGARFCFDMDYQEK